MKKYNAKRKRERVSGVIGTIRDTVDSKFNSIFKKLLDKKMKTLTAI